MKRILLFLLCALIVSASAQEPEKPKAPDDFRPNDLPVRALMLYGVPASSLEPFLAFVRHDLKHEGITHLIFQIDYNYEYKTHPELRADGAYTEAQIKSLVAACREAGVKLVPLLNCLGHQSWAEKTHKLLTTYPQLDETPNLYPGNKDIYCRSYCPNHPDVHRIVFDLLGEVAAAFEADALHVGMDEVFLIGEDNCPRCQGRDKAELFAQEVRTLRDFLHTKGVKLWLWGDRLLDGRATGLGKWEGSFNNTHRAIDLIPKDVVICDWHYDIASPTAAYLALKGFEVISCSWNKPPVAAAQVDDMVGLRTNNRQNKTLRGRFLGVMSTNWGGSDKFAERYRQLKASPAEPTKDTASAANFIRMCERVREVAEKK